MVIFFQVISHLLEDMNRRTMFWGESRKKIIFEHRVRFLIVLDRTYVDAKTIQDSDLVVYSLGDVHFDS
jgi:hypothetical protein